MTSSSRRQESFFRAAECSQDDDAESDDSEGSALPDMAELLSEESRTPRRFRLLVARRNFPDFESMLDRGVQNTPGDGMLFKGTEFRELRDADCWVFQQEFEKPSHSTGETCFYEL